MDRDRFLWAVEVVATSAKENRAAAQSGRGKIERAVAGGTMATATGRYGAMEMRHSRSEDLLGVISSSRSPSPSVPLTSTASEDDLIAASALHEASDSGNAKAACPLLSSRVAGPAGFLADRIDPEDSIRDIVTENDLYRFVR